MSYVFALGALSASIAFHELGHFLACKLTGVPAPVFSVGVGPALCLRTEKTEYRLSPLLFAGYVLMDDDYKQSPTQDFLVSLAGPVFSILGALICMQVAVAYAGYGWNPMDLLRVLAKMVSEVGVPDIHAKDVMSVVGIVKTQAAAMTPMEFWWTAGLVNFSIGITNLLPILPLDGGRCLFAALRGITGKQLEVAKVVTTCVGLILLLSVLGLGLYNDILR